MQIIEHPTTALWQQVVNQCSYATFFHTPTWAQIIVNTFPQYHIETKGVVLDNGTIAIVPLVASVERNHYFKWYESIYPGVYGGVIAERNLTQTEIDWVFQRLINIRMAYIHIMSNPYSNHGLPAHYKTTTEFTHLLQLENGIDAILNNYRAGHKYSCKHATKLGTRVLVAETEHEYQAYFQIYQDTLARWGRGTLVQYPYSLFAQIYQHRSDNVKLWLAQLDGEIAYGCFVFYHYPHVDYWHAASLSRHHKVGAGHLLLTEIIRDACARGFRYLDFNPSGGLRGVEEFKEGFGAQKIEFSSCVWQDNKLHQAFHHLGAWGKRVLKQRAHNQTTPATI
jgi:hypothetical protein